MPTRCTIAGRAMTSSMSGATAGIATPMAGGCCRTYCAGSGGISEARQPPDPARLRMCFYLGDSLIKDRSNQYLMLDSILVRAHQQAATGKGGPATRLWGAPEAD